jgi:hypothetical protein
MNRKLMAVGGGAIVAACAMLLIGCQQSGNHASPAERPEDEPSADSAAVDEQAGAESSTEASAAETAAATATRPIDLAGVEFDLPTTWVEETPSSSMRLAQYKLPGPAGDADLVVYYFGPTGAGDIEANVQRWLGEYSGVVESTKLSALKNKLFLTIVRIAGTYSPRGTAPEAQRPEPRPNYYTFAAVVSGGPEGPLYVKAVGPIETVNAHADEVGLFLDSVRLASKGGG